MKKQRLKNYLKLGILLFGISFFLTNCEKETFEVEQTTNSKYSLSRIDLKQIQKNEALIEKIGSIENSIKKTKSNLQARYENVQFNLNLNSATYIEATDGSYHSYSFYIENYENNFNINNIVLSSTENGEYEADLVTYSLTEEERNQINNGIEMDLINKTTIKPFDINQINMYSRGGTCMILVAVDTVESCSAGHNVSSCSTSCCGGCYNNVYEWQSVDCGSGASTGGTNSGSDGPRFDGSSGTGSSSGGSSDGSDPKATSLTGTDGSIIKDPCKNTRELLAQYPEYRQKLIDLAQTVNEDHENAVGIYKDGTEFEESGTALNTFVDLNQNPNSKYIAIAHTHYETSTTPSEDTYSIFSPNDLQFYSQRLRENELDYRKFVAFLITGKGTRYALTINNKSKFLDFFKYVEINRKWENGEASTPEETNYVINTIVPIYDKYFDKESIPKAPIKKGNTDNNEVLEAFLQFMDEADMGVNLFSIDDTFTNYTQLNYDTSEPNNIKETPCN